MFALCGIGLLATSLVAGVRVAKFKRAAQQLVFDAVPLKPQLSNGNLIFPLDVLISNPTETHFQFTTPQILIEFSGEVIAWNNPEIEGLIPILDILPAANRSFKMTFQLPLERMIYTGQAAAINLINRQGMDVNVYIKSTVSIPILPLIRLNHDLVEVVPLTIKP